MKSFVQFGAGNIGRSFLGQLFSRAGYAVIFIDVNPALIAALNRHREYRVVIKSAAEETITVRNVAGILGTDREAVAAALSTCDLAGTSVGKGALPYLMAPIAAGLMRRDPARPLDIIIAENIHDGADLFRRGLAPLLPPGFDLAGRVGLVETSIGKMVPIMKAGDIAADPLWVFAEPYNTLILDRRGFKNPVPAVPGLDAKENIKAFVDRKLYIHNLGHAAAAYIGHVRRPGTSFLWEVLTDPVTLVLARGAMTEARDALLALYPAEFTAAVLDAHIADLLARFQNRHLSDTVFRVGRDLKRKLARDDRLTGGLLLCARLGLPSARIALATGAGFAFHATDEQGRPDPADAAVHAAIARDGLRPAVAAFTGLAPGVAAEAALLDTVVRHAEAVRTRGAEYLAEKAGASL
ncbi:MAG: mannitol-1-phosphate 5-dehydrogenase [Planctomycetota bacterium]